MASVHEYEKSLGGYLYAKLAEIPGLTLYGPSPSTCPDRAALVAFNHESVHPSDLATFLDQARDRAEIAPRYTRDHADTTRDSPVHCLILSLPP